MVLRLLRISTICVSLATGCFDPGGDGAGEGADAAVAPTGGDGLIGDWLNCADLECSSLGDDGNRFTDDGSVFELDARDGAVEGQPVCVVVGELFGRYTFADDVLSLDDGTEYRLELDGDRLRLSEAGGGFETVMVRIEAREMASCESADPGPTP